MGKAIYLVTGAAASPKRWRPRQYLTHVRKEA